MKIGYFADGPWSHLGLHKILNDQRFSLAFICVRFKSEDETLRNIALEKNIPFLRHKNINSDEFHSIVQDFGADIFVSMSFDQIFKKKTFSLPRLQTINCHAGKLPFYRGRNCLNWALINDEKEIGVTVHYIDEGIDTGDIILQTTYPITDEDDYKSVLESAYVRCAETLYDALVKLEEGTAQRIDQKTIHPVGFYCSQRKVGDELIDWSQSSREIFNFIRSICTPGPQAITFLNGEEIKINKSQLIEGAPEYKGIPGAILGKDSGGILVKTGNSFIRITEYTDVKLRVGDRFQ